MLTGLSQELLRACPVSRAAETAADAIQHHPAYKLAKREHNGAGGCKQHVEAPQPGGLIFMQELVAAR